MNKMFILIVLLLTGAAGADAQTIRGKARNEHDRIAQGIDDGSLTRSETRRLVREQRHIHNDIRRAKANDGHIGPVERMHILSEERRASRHIYRAKHNGRYRA
jgi:hypothetical protein